MKIVSGRDDALCQSMSAWQVVDKETGEVLIQAQGPMSMLAIAAFIKYHKEPGLIMLSQKYMEHRND